MTAPPGLLLIHGEDRFSIDGEARSWLAAARSQCSSELNVEVFDAPARLDQVRRSLGEVPFLDPERYVLIRDAPQLGERSRRGSDGPEVLAGAIAQRSPTTSVCLAAHHRVAPAHPVLRAVREGGGVVVQRDVLRGRELRAWLERRLVERGLRLPRTAVDHLLRVGGADLGVLEGEVEKLASYAAGGGALTAEAVTRLAAGDEQVAIWEVVERLLSPPPGRGAAALEGLLADGVSSQYLITTLAGQLRDLLVAQDLLAQKGGGPAALSRDLGLPPWRAERLARQAGAVPTEVVEEWLRTLQRLDADVKGGRANDADGLVGFGLRAARSVARPGEPGRR